MPNLKYLSKETNSGWVVLYPLHDAFMAEHWNHWTNSPQFVFVKSSLFADDLTRIIFTYSLWTTSSNSQKQHKSDH